MGEIIYNPAKEYQHYLTNHLENSNAFFDDLVKKSNVDIKANAETIKKINLKQNKIKNINSYIKRLKGWKKFIIFLYILIPIIAFFSVVYTLETFKTGIQEAKGIGIFMLITLIMTFLLLLLILLHIKKIKPKINDGEKSIFKLENQVDDLKKEAYAQMNGLNTLFKNNIAKRLFEKTINIFKFDDFFSTQRANFFKLKGFQFEDNNTSTLAVQSGELVNNPFLISKRISHTMGMKNYHGSIVISWTTSSRDSKGNLKTNVHTQTLTATVTKSCPFYKGINFLTCYSDLADNLTFLRNPMDYFDTSERFIKKGLKSLEKKATNAINKNKNFNMLNNSEFELFFNCSERSDEIEFRLLFSPLAQTQLIDVIKENKEYANEKFQMQKQNNLTTIWNEALNNISLNFDSNIYKGFDFEYIKDFFIKNQISFFKDFYHSFIQILAIPLYQEKRTADAIWNDKQQQNFASWEHEAIANSFMPAELAHTESITENIIKTDFIKNQDNIEYIKVESSGFAGQNMIDYVSVFGGDGRYHRVPVEWVQYTPVKKESIIVIKEVNNKDEDLNVYNKIEEIIECNKINKNKTLLKSQIASFILNDSDDVNDIIESITNI